MEARKDHKKYPLLRNLQFSPIKEEDEQYVVLWDASKISSEKLILPLKFGAPMAEWLRGDFGRQAERQVLGSKLLDQGFFKRQWIEGRFREHLEGRRDHALHLWMLFNLTAWYDHWIEGAVKTTGEVAKAGP